MEMMRAADHILDLGPGAGSSAAKSSRKEPRRNFSRKAALKAFPRSETVKYLTGSVPLYNPENSRSRRKIGSVPQILASLKSQSEGYLRPHSGKPDHDGLRRFRFRQEFACDGEIYPLMHNAFGRGDKRRKARAARDFPESVKLRGTRDAGTRFRDAALHSGELYGRSRPDPQALR